MSIWNTSHWRERRVEIVAWLERLDPHLVCLQEVVHLPDGRNQAVWLGDQAGYAIGRWGGSRLVDRFSRLLGSRERLEQTQAQAREWGGPGIFFSRWLITALGPWVNLASGIAEYSWTRFLIWDVAGEFLGALIYILLGRVFSDSVITLDELLGDFSWAMVALLAAVLIGWKLFKK